MDAYPEDWTVDRLGNIGELYKGSGISRAQADSGDLPAIRYGELYTTHSDYVKEYRSRISAEVAKVSVLMKRGDIAFAASGETEEEIGKCAVVCDDGVYAGGDLICFRAKAEIDPLFWGFMLNTPVVQRQKTAAAQGATVIHIRRNSIADLIVGYPPIEEQKRIGAALKDIDSLIDNLSKRIEKKKAIKQGAMQELLTGKKRLPGFEGEWLVKSIAKSATVKARIGWQGLTTQEYLADGSYRLVNGTNIENGAVNWGSCYYVAEDRYGEDKNIQLRQADVLVSKDGTIGKVAFVERLPLPATLNSGVFVVRSKDYDLSQEYLARVFLSKWFDDFIDKITAGSTIVHLYQKDITKFQFLIPPTLAEQRAIAKVLGDMDAEIAKLEAKCEKLTGIKKGMMSDLLTGKVRLKGGTE